MDSSPWKQRFWSEQKEEEDGTTTWITPHHLRQYQADHQEEGDDDCDNHNDDENDGEINENHFHRKDRNNTDLTSEDENLQHHDDRLFHDDEKGQAQLFQPEVLDDQIASILALASIPLHDKSQMSNENKKVCDDNDDSSSSSSSDDDDVPGQLRLERARYSQVIRPGAVAVRGSSFMLRTASTTSLDDLENNEDQHEDSYAIMNGHRSAESLDAVLVVPEEDIERPDEDVEARRRRQEEERAEEFAIHVREAILQSTVQAEVMVEKASGGQTKVRYTRKFRWIWLLCMTVALIVVIVIIVVPTVLTSQARHRHQQQQESQTQTPGNNGTNSITSNATDSNNDTESGPPCIYCLEYPGNLTSDFLNATNLTIFELLQTGNDHIKLPEFLAVTGLFALADSSNITFIAPVDKSFDDLPVPYAYYQTNFYWIYHLNALISYHIVIEPLNSTEMFQLEQLPTPAGPNLTANGSDGTLGNDDAIIVLADIPATNGYIQIPDRVLLPYDLRRTIFEAAHDLFTSDSGFSIFGRLLNWSGVESTLSEQQFLFPNGLTLLMPTDAALLTLDANYLAQLNSNKSLAREFVMYHFFPVNAYQEVIVSIVRQISFLSINCMTLWFTATNFDTVAYANGKPIQESIYSYDGLIHVLDDALVPPSIGEMMQITTSVTDSPQYNFTTFLALAQGSAQLESLLFIKNVTEGSSHPLTVFAPLQDAFDLVETTNEAVWGMLQEPSQWRFHIQNLLLHHCIPREIRNSALVVGEFQYQMLSGYNISLHVFTEGNVTNDDLGNYNLVDGNFVVYPNFTVDGRANVTLNNLVVARGLVYGINQVLLPPWTSLSVYQTLLEMPELSILASLVKSANLTSLLSDTKGITLLAPKNDALSQVDATNVTLVRDLIFRHVLVGNVYSADLDTTKVIVSFNHQNYTVTTVDNNIVVEASHIVVLDRLASNGVIQEIDRLLK